MKENHNYDAISYILRKINNGEYTIGQNGLLYKNKKRLGTVDRDGYLRYTSRVNGKAHPCASHRVMFAYYYGIDELKKHETINHIDGDKLNNASCNLEGCTISENVVHMYRIGLGQNSVEINTIKAVKKLFSMGYSRNSISKHMNLNHHYVTKIVTNKINKDVEYDDYVIVDLPESKRKNDRKRLTDDQVVEISRMIDSGILYDEIIEKYSITKRTILKIKRREYQILQVSCL